jgi:hypothetical protein
MGFEVTFSPTSLRKSGENSIIFYIYRGNPWGICVDLRGFSVDFAWIFCPFYAGIYWVFCESSVDSRSILRGFAWILGRFCVDFFLVLARQALRLSSLLRGFAWILGRFCVDFSSFFSPFVVGNRWTAMVHNGDVLMKPAIGDPILSGKLAKVWVITPTASLPGPTICLGCANDLLGILGLSTSLVYQARTEVGEISDPFSTPRHLKYYANGLSVTPTVEILPVHHGNRVVGMTCKVPCWLRNRLSGR